MLPKLCRVRRPLMGGRLFLEGKWRRRGSVHTLPPSYDPRLSSQSIRTRPHNLQPWSTEQDKIVTHLDRSEQQIYLEWHLATSLPYKYRATFRQAPYGRREIFSSSCRHTMLLLLSTIPAPTSVSSPPVNSGSVLIMSLITDTDPNTGKNRSTTIFRYCCEFRYSSRSWQTQ